MLLCCFLLLSLLLFFVAFVLIDVVAGVLVVLCRFTSDCFLDVVVLFLAIVVATVLRCLCFNRYCCWCSCCLSFHVRLFLRCCCVVSRYCCCYCSLLSLF